VTNLRGAIERGCLRQPNATRDSLQLHMHLPPHRSKSTPTQYLLNYTTLNTTHSADRWHEPAAAMSGKLTTDVDKRLLRTTKFPPEFNVKVDMTKVNFPVIKRWVQDEIERILGTQDEVVMNTIFNLVEESRYVSQSGPWLRMEGNMQADSEG